jgi:uncharacterized protein YhjY with autotransporter beta-barrel domain
MQLRKKTLLQILGKFLLLVLFYTGVQSTAYAVCAPSVTPAGTFPVPGDNITLNANCDASEGPPPFLWAIFGSTYNSDASGNLTLTVPVDGTGIQSATVSTAVTPAGYSFNISVGGGGSRPPTRSLTIAPASYTFPDSKVGFTQNQIFTITNTGNGQIGINGINVQGANAGDFSAGISGCPSVIFPAAQCTFAVTFTPQTIGKRIAEVALLTDQGSTLITAVSGLGLDPKVTLAATALVASPSPFVFPFTKIGQISQRTITLTNAGTTILRVDQSSLGGLNFKDFSLQDSCNDFTLAPAGTCVLTVTLLPTVAGTRSGLIIVNAEGPDRIIKPYLEIAIIGESATTGANSLVATPASLSFGSKKLNEASSLVINLVNNLTINGSQDILAALSGDGDFVILSNDCVPPLNTRPNSKLTSGNNAQLSGSTIRKRETLTGCTVTVTFTPTVLGIKNAVLDVTDAQGNTLAIPITGGGTAGLTDAQIRQIATQQITANLQSMQTGLQAQLSNINKRLRYLRFQDSVPTFRQEIDLSLNGKSMPLPDGSGGGGGCVSSGGKNAATSSREQCEEDYKATRNGRWGTYITGGVGVSENTENGVKINANGITLGGDYRLSGKSALGGAFGAMKSNTEMAGEAGKQDATGYSLVGYGSFAPSQASFIDFALTLGKGKFDLQRLESGGTNAVADTSGTGVGLSMSAGLDWRDGAWAITPYLRAEYINSKVKGFTESGKDTIQVGDQSLTSSMFSVGAEAQYTASTSWGIFIPHARIEIQQQSQSSPDATAQAVGSSIQLTVSPDLNKDKSFGNAALGASAQFGKGKTGFLDFEKTFGKDNFKDQRITAGYKIEF